MSTSESQAARIIRICGIKCLSKWTGVSETSVYRWDHPKEKGGCGGVIPSEHHQPILNGAISEGVKLRPADFFETPEADDLQEILPIQPLKDLPVSRDNSKTSSTELSKTTDPVPAVTA